MGPPQTFAPPFDHAQFADGRMRDWRSLFASRPLPAFDGRGAKVTIIGGGIAGLVAAFEFARRNFTVRVLECRAEIGGRIRTHRFDKVSYGELGAMRISAAHACVLDYVTELGLDIREFANWNPSGLFHLKGKRGALRRPGDVKGSFAARCGDAFPSLDLLRGDPSAGAASLLFDRLNDGLNRIRPRVDLLEVLRTRAHYTPSPVLAQTLRDFALGELVGMSEDDWLILSRLGGAAPLAECSLQQFVLDMLPLFNAPMFEIVGGMSRLADALTANLPSGAISLSATVRQIERRDSELRVTYDFEGRTISESTNYVLVTAPPLHLHAIRFAGLPVAEQLAESIKRLQVRPLFKCLALCDRPYWVADSDLREGGLLPTDTPLTQVWYPSPLAENNRVMTAAYAFASYAEQWTKVSDTAAVRAAVTSGLREVHSDLDDVGNSIGELAHTYWDNGYTYLEPRTYRNLLYSMTADGCLDERVAFAGEHMGPMHGWIVSAVMPAQYAVSGILTRHASDHATNAPSS